MIKGRRHTPQQVVRKLREADRLLEEGFELPDLLKELEVSEATYLGSGVRTTRGRGAHIHRGSITEGSSAPVPRMRSVRSGWTPATSRRPPVDDHRLLSDVQRVVANALQAAGH